VLGREQQTEALRKLTGALDHDLGAGHRDVGQDAGPQRRSVAEVDLRRILQDLARISALFAVHEILVRKSDNATDA
jgi:hypothetical protein